MVPASELLSRCVVTASQSGLISRHISQAQWNEVAPRVDAARKYLKPLVYTSFDGDNMRYMYWMCYVAHALGYVPINPEAALGAYISIHAHQGVKGELIRDCIALEMCCDEFWIFDTPSSDALQRMPEGVLAELMLWRASKPHQPVRHFPWLEPGTAHKKHNHLQPRAQAETLRHARLCALTLNDIIADASAQSAEELRERVVRPVREQGLRPLTFLSQDAHDFKHVDWARAMVYQHGYVPLSPDTLLNPLATDLAHGHDAALQSLHDRASVLDRAEELWLFLHPKIRLGECDEPLPDTVVFDLLYWLQHKPNLPIRAFSWREAGVPKYAKGDWALTSQERREVHNTAELQPMPIRRRGR